MYNLSKKKAPENKIRDQAIKRCDDIEGARAAWLRVSSDGRCHGKTSRAARLAMLSALADGASVKVAESAAWSVLES